MKYIDFGIQTIIFIFALGLLGITIANRESLMAILYAQLLLGPWQLLSSLISVCSRSDFHKEKRIHLFTSIGYLIVLFSDPDLPSELVAYLYTIPAWLLAIYYYYLTYQWAFRLQKSNGGFLRHINF